MILKTSIFQKISQLHLSVGLPFFIVFSLAMLSFSNSAYSQTISNVVATMRGDMIVVEYDLISNSSATEFKISLYGSHNNYREPIRFVTGDVGERVMPGSRRTIMWAVKNELINFTGDIQFEVRGEPVIIIRPFAFVKPIEGSLNKRTTKLNLEWTGGGQSENVQLQLIQADQTKNTIGTVVNTGTYTWKIPSNTPPGTYHVALIGTSGSASSMSFQIKPKYNLIVKLLPILVIGGVVASQLGGGGGGGTSGGSNDLPTPPNSPN